MSKEKSVFASITDGIFGLGEKVVNLYDDFLTTDAKRVANSQRVGDIEAPINEGEDYYTAEKDKTKDFMLYVGIGLASIALIYVVYKKI